MQTDNIINIEVAPISVRAGTVKHMILQAVEVMPRSVEEILSQVKHATADRGHGRFQAHYIQPLVIGGLLEAANDQVSLTELGRGIVENLRAAPSTENLVKANLLPRPTEAYIPKELGYNSHRPGAYDFLRHQSLLFRKA